MMDLFDDNEIVKLNEKDELRFVVDKPGQKIVLQLFEGTAELFGSQLCFNKDYEFIYFSSVTIFSWSGCTLKMKKTSRIKYKIKTSEEVPKMRELHDYLESFRKEAETRKSVCPITILTGPTDVGKSTLCRYLLNYASREGRTPIYVDLDVGQSSISITGTFGVLPINKPSDVTGRFDDRASSVYYFGYKSPGHNMSLYKLLLRKLGGALKSRLIHKSDTLKGSGVIIDTCGWVVGPGYRLILEIINIFEVNVVLVVGDKSLHSKLMNDLSSKIEITRVSELEGVSVRNQTVRNDNRNSSVYRYFYGSLSPMKPFTIKVNFSNLQIYKTKLPSDNDLYCSRTVDSNSNILSVPIEPRILYQVFGLSYADYIEDILLKSVYGFICIIDLDMDSEVASVLTPNAGPLPTKYLLMGDITLLLQDVK